MSNVHLPPGTIIGQHAYIKDAIEAYKRTLLWSTINSDTGEPLDNEYTIDDVTDWSEAEEDVHDFIVSEWQNVHNLDPEHVGHDFCLTRNGHGAGFWDGDYPEPQATALTDASKVYGEQVLYIGYGVLHVG